MLRGEGRAVAMGVRNFTRIPGPPRRDRVRTYSRIERGMSRADTRTHESGRLRACVLAVSTCKLIACRSCARALQSEDASPTRASAASPRAITFCSRRSMISHCRYICRNRRSASLSDAARMRILSTRWPVLVRMLNPYRTIANPPLALYRDPRTLLSLRGLASKIAMIDQLPRANTLSSGPFPAKWIPPARPSGSPTVRNRSSAQLSRASVAHGDSKRSHRPRSLAPCRRRVLGDFPCRSVRPGPSASSGRCRN